MPRPREDDRGRGRTIAMRRVVLWVVVLMGYLLLCTCIKLL